MLYRFLLSFFGVGFMPFAPGTFGSLAGMVLAVRINWLSLGVLTALWTYWTHKTLDKKDPDPSWIVVDEVAGICLAWLIYQAINPYTHLLSLLLVFFWFRVFDILKPFPIGYVERKLSKNSPALGLMLDDLLAGAFAALAAFYTSPNFLQP